MKGDGFLSFKHMHGRAWSISVEERLVFILFSGGGLGEIDFFWFWFRFGWMSMMMKNDLRRKD